MRNFKTGLIVMFVLIVSIWLQMNLWNRLPLFGVKANMGIVIVVALSTLCGQGVGSVIGTTYGVLTDVLFGKTFGIYTLLFFGVGFFCGRMGNGFSKENKSAVAMITILTTFVLEVSSYFLFVLFYHYDWELWTMLKTIVIEAIYNVLLARIFFVSMNWLAEIVNKGKRSYYLL